MDNTKVTYLDKIIHEMNGLIHNIYFLSEMMLQGKVKLSKIDHQKNLYQIHVAAEKLAKIVSLLSKITNIKSDKVELKLEELDLIELVEQETKYHQVRNRTNPDLKIALNNKVVSGCTAKVDEFWFKQLLANLLMNAVNHCEKGLIEVCTDIVKNNDAEYFSLKVIDEGCGIPDSELETIFKPLKRGTHSIGKIPGSGIGLAITREVAEGHGGSILARNNAKGGAEFEAVIPLSRLNT